MAITADRIASFPSPSSRIEARLSLFQEPLTLEYPHKGLERQVKNVLSQIGLQSDPSMVVRASAADSSYFALRGMVKERTFLESLEPKAPPNRQLSRQWAYVGEPLAHTLDPLVNAFMLNPRFSESFTTAGRLIEEQVDFDKLFSGYSNYPEISDIRHQNPERGLVASLNSGLKLALTTELAFLREGNEDLEADFADLVDLYLNGHPPAGYISAIPKGATPTLHSNGERKYAILLSA